MIYHVAKTGVDTGIGSSEQPFLTISKAAEIAVAGDQIIVHEGIYRESVQPRYGGLSDTRRITYMAADGEAVAIKGSEVINNWENVEKGIWKVTLDNDFFGDFNPYKEIIFGDWVVTLDITKHLGDVYLNGMSFYEALSYNEMKDATEKKETLDHWTNLMTPVINVNQTKYMWYTESDELTTTIYGNFHDSNPNEELVEINVRQTCFYPKEIGINYITVKGFELAQAATPWAPPTADQPGMLGTHWSKGWIIEDNIFHDAKCSALSIGKEVSTGHNYRSVRRDKPGYIYQLESVFNAERAGWSKETIGSHIIRNNVMYDCGQNGIVGHLGCVFSEIYNNHIYNIAIKREFYGHEIAGIKLHAAIDVQIHDNHIHNCSLGLWSDWQTQGTRVYKNLFYNNNRDVFIEVSHGPYMVDHNIMASPYALDNISQGGAYINNIIAGKMNLQDVLDRSTQYHLPHSTKIKGFTLIYGGDDRFYNNIYIGGTDNNKVGTSQFDDRPTSLEEYINEVDRVPGDHRSFNLVKQPVYIDNNLYLNGAEPFNREESPYVNKDFNPEFSITQEEDGIYLNCILPEDYSSYTGIIHSTATLPRVRIVDAEFEQANGQTLVLNEDYFSNEKTGLSNMGPIANLKAGINKIKVAEI